MGTFDMTLLHTLIYAYDIAHEENAMSPLISDELITFPSWALSKRFYYKKFAATNKQL